MKVYVIKNGNNVTVTTIAMRENGLDAIEMDLPEEDVHKLTDVSLRPDYVNGELVFTAYSVIPDSEDHGKKKTLSTKCKNKTATLDEVQEFLALLFPYSNAS